MFPGLTRTAAQPASMAAKTYLGWKWMSAITGIWDFLAITGSASASSWLGTATRTISQPVAVSSAICCRVALMSAVSVVVIDCTLIGASPPTATLPTLIWRLLRRGARGGGGRAGTPRSMLIRPLIRRWGETLTSWLANNPAEREKEAERTTLLMHDSGTTPWRRDQKGMRPWEFLVGDRTFVPFLPVPVRSVCGMSAL